MDVLSQKTFIRPQDFALLRVVETAEEAVSSQRFLGGQYGQDTNHLKVADVKNHR
jgi:hypothetical protein